MPVDVQADADSEIPRQRGQNRHVWRNTRGTSNENWFVVYQQVSGALVIEYSTDGSDWTNSPTTLDSGDHDCVSTWVQDDGSDFIVWVVYIIASSNVLGYRRLVIADSDTGNPGTIGAQDTIDTLTDVITGDKHACAVTRTRNGRMVVAATDDFTNHGKDFRQTWLWGSDDDSANPAWTQDSSAIVDPSADNNNDGKGKVWPALYGFDDSGNADSFVLVMKVPEASSATRYEVRSAAPTWGGTTFGNLTTVSMTGPSSNSTEHGVLGVVVDSGNRAHAVINNIDSGNLESYRAGTASDDDWATAVNVKTTNTGDSPLSIAVDTTPATDKLYIFYKDTADTTGIHYKSSDVSSPHSWSSESDITYSEDVIEISASQTQQSGSIHLCGVKATDDVWYHEFDVSVGDSGFETLAQELILQASSFATLAQNILLMDSGFETLAQDVQLFGRSFETVAQNLLLLASSVETLAQNIQLIGRSFETVAQDLQLIGRSFETLAQNLVLMDSGFETLAQDVQLIGRSFATVAQDVILVGSSFETLLQNVALHGRSFATLAQDVQLIGRSFETLQQDLQLLGRSFETLQQDVQLHGRSFETLAQDVQLHGRSFETVAQDVQLSGVLSGFETLQQDLHLLDSSFETLAQDVQLIGRSFATVAQNAILVASSFETLQQDVQLHGRSFETLAQDVQLHGRSLETIAQDIQLHGRSFETVDQDVHLSESGFNTVAQDVQLIGRFFETVAQSIILVESGFATLAQDVHLLESGFNTVAQDVQLHGRSFETLQQDVQLTGVLSGFETLAQSIIMQASSTGTLYQNVPIVPASTSLAGIEWLYTAENYAPNAKFYLEVFMRATTGTVFASLYNADDATVVPISFVTTVSGTFLRVRSVDIKGQLIDGKQYTAQFGHASGDAGEFKNAKVVAVD